MKDWMELLLQLVKLLKEFLPNTGCFFCFKSKELKIENKRLQTEHEELNLRLKKLRELEPLLEKAGISLDEKTIEKLKTFLVTVEDDFIADRRAAKWLKYKREILIKEALKFLVQNYHEDFKLRKKQEEASLTIESYFDYMYDCLYEGTLSYELDVESPEPIFPYQQALKFVRGKMDTADLSPQGAIRELEACFDHLLALIEKKI